MTHKSWDRSSWRVGAAGFGIFPRTFETDFTQKYNSGTQTWPFLDLGVENDTFVQQPCNVRENGEELFPYKKTVIKPLRITFNSDSAKFTLPHRTMSNNVYDPMQSISIFSFIQKENFAAAKVFVRLLQKQLEEEARHGSSNKGQTTLSRCEPQHCT